jgi:hypothetical protein
VTPSSGARAAAIGRATAGGRAAATWAARRPTAAAALLYALMALALFGAGLLPGSTLSASDYLWSATPWEASRPPDVRPLGSNFEQADAAQFFQPALQVVRASLPHVPLWDPALLGGRPLVADPQAAIFSPFSVPAYVLPFWTSLAAMAALKLVVAAMGAFLLARVVGMRAAPATVTGLVFGFALWSVAWVSWTTMSVWAFLPWVCLACELCVRRPGPLPAAGLAAAVGAQFVGGHPSSSLQCLAAVGLFFLVRCVADPAARDRIGLRLLALGAGALAGAALAAAMLVPFAELLLRSSDLDVRRGASALLHQQPRTLLGLVLHDYWGHGRTSQLFGYQQQERAYYVGALPLLLAAAALVVRPRRERVAVAVAGATALMVATGLPPAYDLVVALPVFETSNNGRVAVLGVLALALLAGWGLDDLLAARPGPRRRAILLGAAAVLVLAPAIVVAGQVSADAIWPAVRVAWASADPRAVAESVTGGLGALLKAASLAEWLVVAAAAGALLALRLSGRLAASPFAALAVVLVAADLLKAGAGHNPVIPIDHARQPATGAIRFLQAQEPARFVGLWPTARVALTTPLPPNVAMRYDRLYDARGYVLPTERRVFRLSQRRIAFDPGCYYFFCTLMPAARPAALRALGLLGVSHLLQNRGDPPLRDLAVAYAGADARIYRNPHALPRSFLVDRQRVVPGGDAALAAVTAPGFPARRVAVTERRVPGIPDDAAGAGASAPSRGTSRIERYEPERVVIRAEARRPSLLVLGDTWYPGWTAAVDGRQTPVERVDYLLRGVRVPAGAHRVELRYEPLSWRVGWIVSVVALLGVAAAMVLGVRRRRPT